MRSFSSLSPIVLAMNARCVALPNMLKMRFFDTVSAALRSIFVASYIEDLEVILRVVANLFPIHHFVVGPMVKYLIGGEVLM